jgi:hypothetical protein
MTPEHQKFYRIACTLLIAALLSILPVSAVTIAIYGDTAGFVPDLHRDEFVVAYSLDGSSGTDLDRDIARYTDPSVDIIFIGGDDSFGAETALQIEAAVATGKILVVTNKPYRKFNASLPAENAGPAPAGAYLIVRDPDSPVSQNIFAGLRTQFPNTNPLSERVSVVAKPGSVTLLEYENRDPALIYGRYGSGHVIEWAMTSPRPFLNTTEGDFINVRLIRSLRTMPVTTVPAATTVPVTATITPQETKPPVVLPDRGSMMIYSSPTGANILIDGIYYGTTPGNLTGIAQGNHILRLTQSGYYDYEGTIYVLPGQTSHAFGTLQPVNQISAPAATPVPIIIPVVTAEPTSSAAKGPLENPGVLVAIIGVITASIAAVTTIFTQVNKVKKEIKEGKE